LNEPHSTKPISDHVSSNREAIAVVQVGGSQDKFYVHAKLLRSASGFFAATLNKVLDTPLHIVKLPEVNPAEFEV
jgi:hypothetical protein